MPGHVLGSDREIEGAKTNVNQLAKLIEEHDIIFLLMDSRESRWLPTVLGTYFRKVYKILVICVMLYSFYLNSFTDSY